MLVPRFALPVSTMVLLAMLAVAVLVGAILLA